MTRRPTAAELLEFEQTSPTDRRAKKIAIRKTFGISSALYWSYLYEAIDRPEAMRSHPELVRALLKQRETGRLRSGLAEPVARPAAAQASLFEEGLDRSRMGKARGARPSSEGEARKVAGMALADAAADEAWKARVDVAIAELATKGEPFTAEDVRKIAGDPPAHPNAMGARFNSAARRGVIAKAGYRLAERASLHRHPIALWVGAEAGAA